MFSRGEDAVGGGKPRPRRKNPLSAPAGPRRRGNPNGRGDGSAKNLKALPPSLARSALAAGAPTLPRVVHGREGTSSASNSGAGRRRAGAPSSAGRDRGMDKDSVLARILSSVKEPASSESGDFGGPKGPSDGTERKAGVGLGSGGDGGTTPSRARRELRSSVASTLSRRSSDGGSDTVLTDGLGWDDIRRLGKQLGVPSEPPDLPPHLQHAVACAEASLAVQAGADSKLVGETARKDAAKARHLVQEAVERLKAEVRKALDASDEAKKELSLCQRRFESAQAAHASALAKQEQDFQTTILKLERRHNIDLARAHKHAASGMGSSDEAAPTAATHSEASEKAMELVSSLTARLQASEKEWASDMLRLETEKRHALEALREKHAAEQKEANAEIWRLQDSLSLLQRQLTDMAKQTVRASELESASKSQLETVEKENAELRAQVATLSSQNTRYKQVVAAYEAHYGTGGEEEDEEL